VSGLWRIAAPAIAGMIGLPLEAWTQQLEPRAYSPAPVGVNFAGAIYTHVTGGAPLDPSLPLKNTHVEVESPALFYVRTFDFLGRQASAGLLLPYAWESGSAGVLGQDRSARRSGPADPYFRLATNLIGGPALTADEFAARTPSTAVGTSLTVVAPFGQYYANNLLNIGSNRWAFKPDLGISQPIGPWSLELSGGAWLFTDNSHSFGGVRRAQDPIVTTQAHLGYNFLPGLWLAVDGTYYVGGQSTVNGIRNNDRQEATRIGVTLSLPLAKGYSLKLAWSDTIATRLSGSGFTAYMATLQITWFDP
jgi:Putative MetA-pathway of phenol degradation